MGRGNVCVTGQYEGLFYIDNDQFFVYRRDDEYDEEPETRLMKDLDYAELTGGDWMYDEWGTGEEQDDIEECFIEDFTRMFPAFERAGSNKWLGRYQRVILESKLFYICIEDNEWSLAVELIMKEPPWGYCIEGLQARHYQRYLDGMRDCLFNRLDELGTYSGAWTSGRIRREDFRKEAAPC